MKVIAINGSPRKEGSTAFYLSEVLNRIEANGIDTELVQLADYNLAPCNACMECWNQQSLCTIDDGLAGICKKILGAEGLLLGSPVYYGGVTSAMKAFIDRSGYGFWAMTGFKQADWNNPKKQIRPLRNKVGAVIVTGYRIGMTSTLSQLLLYLLDMEMVIASGTWTAGMLCSAFTEKGEYDIKKDKEGLLYAHHLGENMSLLIKKLHE